MFVAIMIPWFVAILVEVPSDHIIDETVPVIINSVVRDLAGIGPKIVPIEIHMIPVDPGINHRDCDGLLVFGYLLPDRVRAAAKPNPRQPVLIIVALAPAAFAR